jgi:ribonuclease Z
VRITAIPVSHGSWATAFAYHIDAPGKRIVLSGDTRPSEALARAAQGVDILVHEVYPSSRLQPESRPGGESWPEYMRAFHTSDVELGRLAAEAKPGLLVLTHIVRMGGSDEELLAGVRRGGFSGRTVVGRDLGRY